MAEALGGLGLLGPHVEAGRDVARARRHHDDEIA
jgi:hypothetical protein